MGLRGRIQRRAAVFRARSAQSTPITVRRITVTCQYLVLLSLFIDMAACDQCGKPALLIVASHPLCIGCYSLLQQTENARVEAANDYLRLLYAQHNQLTAQADLMFGLGPLTPMIRIPSKSAQQYNMIHSVNVGGGSTVGAITTGSAQSIAVAIGNTEKQGNTELAATLKAFTDALTNEPVADEQKREMSEQLATLSEELTKSKEARRRAVIDPMLVGLSKAVDVSAKLASLWAKLHPLLTQAFS